jgi:hypothetical protein
MTTQMHHRRLTALGIVAIASGLVGCSILQEKPVPKLNAEVTAGPAPAGKAAGKYIVEMHPETGKPQAMERDLNEQIHVQTALDQTGATKKWDRLQIDMFRPLPNGGWHKMALEFDRDSRRVPPEFDYAVLPGDRIIVTEDATGFLDDIMERTLEPLGIMPPAKRKKQEASRKYQIRG